MFVYTREAHPGEHVGLPNMTWVIGRGGRIVYKADWTSAENVEGFVRRYRQARSDGPRAYDEFKHAEEIWSTRDRDM
ncbi:MAG: hypothetical protein KY461_04665 [Actinobacteria bacterium]|nr:hypothetical protein [Actinomycetota bacterium]